MLLVKCIRHHGMATRIIPAIKISDVERTMSESDAVKNDPQAAPPGNGELFLGFLMLGLIGFGGVLPLARNMLVEDRR